MMTTLRLQEEIEVTASRVNEFLDTIVVEKEPIQLTQAARHLLQAGGKRLRPFITIRSCEAVGGIEAQAMSFACAVELLHNFTLIHDDIMDKDALRRNVKTVHTIYGEPIAILAGDYLFAKAFEVSSNSPELNSESIVKANRRLADAMIVLAEGQTLDTQFEHQDNVSEPEYIQMVRMKTASLYSASAYVGGCAADADEHHLEALERFGDALGIAFQIKDDILGLTGELDKLGKPIGSDLQKGKKTLIILKALEELSSEKRKKTLRLMSSQRAKPEEIQEATELLLETGAKQYAEERMMEYADRATSALSTLPSNRARELLEACTRFAVERSF
jgi:geranylgeranyl diphosphate synthase, type I